MLDNFWHWLVIIGAVANILACLWLLRWSANTKVKSDDNTTGHIWDEDITELNNPMPRWWLGMFYLSIVFGFFYLILYPGLGNYKGSLGWTQESELTEKVAMVESNIAKTQKFWNKYSSEDLINNRSALETGKRIFANNCAMCDVPWIWWSGSDRLPKSV